MDSTTGDNESQAVSDEWALRQAEQELIDAGDDPAARALAMHRHAQAIRNMMQSALVPSFKQAVEGILAKGLADIRSEFRAAESENQNRVGYFYQQMGAFLTDADARFDRHFATVEEAVAIAGKAMALAETVAAGQAELAGVVSDQGERIDDMDARLLLVEETPGTSPSLLKSMEGIERDMQESKLDRARLRGELRQTRYTVYVIVAIFVFVVLVQLWRG